eukprot:8459771-Ditylum_brightwellii.AAC.1
MNDLRVMDVLDVAVAWDATTPALQNSSKVTNIFDSRGITRAQVKKHADLSAANRHVGTKEPEEAEASDVWQDAVEQHCSKVPTQAPHQRVPV